jgi:N6-adenosine-specific RNA methylase IME4
MKSKPIPTYSIIYADPPWAYAWGKGKDGGNFAPEKHYPTMSTEEIAALPVKQLRAKNAVCAMWCTGPCLPDAFEIMKAWGFKYKTALFVWVKHNPKSKTIVTGPGSYTRSACEYVLLGMRGHIKRISTDPISQVLTDVRGRHSAKPEIVRAHLVKLFGDLPRIELFARETTPGWEAWGNQVESDIKLAA